MRSIAVGVATVLVALLAPRLTKAVPSTILGIVAVVLVYWGLANSDASMMTLADNNLVLGALGASGEGYIGTITGRWYEIGELKLWYNLGYLGWLSFFLDFSFSLPLRGRSNFSLVLLLVWLSSKHLDGNSSFRKDGLVQGFVQEKVNF